MSTGRPTPTRPRSIQGLVKAGQFITSARRFPGQEAIPQEAVGIVRRSGQKPVATPGLAVALDLTQMRLEAPAIKGTQRIGFGVEVTGPLAFEETGGRNRGEFEFLRMDDVKENHVKPRAPEQIHGLPESFIGI